MTVPIIGVEALRASIRLEDLIEPMAQALRCSSAGRAENGQVLMFPLPDRTRADVLVKTATLEAAPVYVVKVAPWFADNARKGRPQGGFVAVFDARTGHTLALLEDQHELSDLRTAATGAVAARALAPPRVTTASVLGSGVQAYWQARALYHERPFAALRVWARRAAGAERLAERLAAALPHVAISTDGELRRVVESGDVVLTATSSREPLVRGEWLREGQHITAVGADDPSKCELDVSALRRARVFVDSIELSAANGDVHRGIRSGGYQRSELAGELGQVLANERDGRRSPQEVTIAKLVGLGAQDLMAASAVLEKLGLAAGGPADRRQ